MYACFIGYIFQAIVNNYIPLLFVTFQKQYSIPLSQITLLIDMLSAGFAQRNTRCGRFPDTASYRNTDN